VISPVSPGRPFADYHAAFGRFVRVLFLAGQKTASAKMAATRRNVCRRCERFLRQQKPHLQKAGLSASRTLTSTAANGSCLAVSRHWLLGRLTTASRTNRPLTEIVPEPVFSAGGQGSCCVATSPFEDGYKAKGR
jgi:hypothetical protein